jgi:hypothetical protein
MFLSKVHRQEPALYWPALGLSRIKAKPALYHFSPQVPFSRISMSKHLENAF